jgi:membrane fusion protein (multidrug efflux system)
MSEKPLKIVPAPEAKTAPVEASASEKSGLAARLGRTRLRMILLVGLPALAALIGLGLYLSGGRYISTDNAYVGAQKVLITPDISDKIIHVAVVEGQHVKAGDELFTLDPEPYRLALDTAQAKLAGAKSNYDKLTTTLKSLITLVDLANKNVEFKQHDFDRKLSLVKSQAGSQADADTAGAALVTAQLQAQFAIQQRDTTLSQLLGNPNLPLAEFPEYAQAKAALDNAQRDFGHTVVRAPISGTATQVDNIQVGRHADPQRDRRPGALGRRQSEGNRHHLPAGRTEGGARRRFIPRSHLQGPRRGGEPRHRRAVLHPAAAERHRKLGQGGAARSVAHRLRQG